MTFARFLNLSSKSPWCSPDPSIFRAATPPHNFLVASFLFFRNKKKTTRAFWELMFEVELLVNSAVVSFVTLCFERAQQFQISHLLTVCSCHVTYTFQSKSTLYSCLNVKELLARSRREIWRWSDCNWTRTQNHLVLKRTLNHLAKLTKWLRCVLSTYLYGVFDCMFLSCHVRLSDWIHTL